MRNLCRPLLVSVVVLASASLIAAQGVGVLTGTVLSTGDKPVAGARVLIQTSDGRRPFTVRTNSEGKFRVSRISRGLYDLRAQAAGNSSDWERNVLVRTGRTTSVTLRLVPKPPRAASVGAPARAPGQP